MAQRMIAALRRAFGTEHAAEQRVHFDSAWHSLETEVRFDADDKRPHWQS